MALWLAHLRDACWQGQVQNACNGFKLAVAAKSLSAN
jgi:hypothetical protein